MGDEIRDQYNEIKSFLEKEGFNIFYVKEFVASEYDHIWDTEYDWKKFFEIAKKEGVKTILTESEDFTLPEDFDEISKDLEKDEIDLIKKNKSKMGNFTFAWYNGVITFTFSKSADWFSKVSSIISSDTSETVSMLTGESEQTKERQEKINELKKLSHEELEEEVREYTTTNELQSESGYSIKEKFLESKNIFGNLREYDGEQIPRLDSITQKLEAENLAKQKKMVPELVKKFVEYIIKTPKRPHPPNVIHQFLAIEGIKLHWELRTIILAKTSERIRAIEKEEREAMPKLLDKAVEWAKQNKKNRFTKADTETFLTDTETSLSRENADMLYSKINSELKKTRF